MIGKLSTYRFPSIYLIKVIQVPVYILYLPTQVPMYIPYLPRQVLGTLDKREKTWGKKPSATRFFGFGYSCGNVTYVLTKTEVSFLLGSLFGFTGVQRSTSTKYKGNQKESRQVPCTMDVLWNLDRKQPQSNPTWKYPYCSRQLYLRQVPCRVILRQSG